MELKKVSESNEKNYAKINEVSKKELKTSLPKKWIASGILGSAVATYTTSNSFFRIGVVFGCIHIDQEGDIITTGLGGLLQTAEIVLIFMLIANILLILVNYGKKSKREIKVYFIFLATISIILLSIFTYMTLNPDKISYIYHEDSTSNYNSVMKDI